jgi:ubiquinone/menaquinone biosynthesis C-methylase UbiE
LDLSTAYIAHARRRWAGRGVDFRAGNAEQLPYPDACFDAVVNVFLLHELPGRVRRDVVSEMLRVLKPGGVLVIEDAAQLCESPELTALLEQFPRDLHEPFFAHYIRDPLEALVESCGGELVRTRPVFVAKLVSAYKP